MHGKTIMNNKIRTDVVLTNNFDIEIYENIIRNSVCAVIDTITATSSITTMFGSGCGKIILSKEVNEAFQLKNILKDYLLCGEENGLKPEGFDYGNFPLEFSKINLKDKNIIFKSTNGTLSFFELIEARHVFAVSLLNLAYSVRIISELALKENKDVFIVCSGTKGRITYEDVYTAGLLIKYLIQLTDSDLSDSARVALDVVRANDGIEAQKVLEKFENIERLKEMGYYQDLIFSAKLNTYNLISNLKILDLKNPPVSNINGNHKDIYALFDGTAENHLFERILLLEKF